MDSFTHKSPAKINTFLNVLSKRNDGYHNIYTHFELIDIFDEINFVPSIKNSFFCNDPDLIKNNIIEKTCSWFNDVFSKKQSFNINLKKKYSLRLWTWFWELKFSINTNISLYVSWRKN